MPKTYNDLYLATRTALKNAGVEAYALEARLLVAYAVGKTKEEFVRDLRLYTSDENEQKIAALLQRRIAGEPLAYTCTLARSLMSSHTASCSMPQRPSQPHKSLTTLCRNRLGVFSHSAHSSRL